MKLRYILIIVALLVMNASATNTIPISEYASIEDQIFGNRTVPPVPPNNWIDFRTVIRGTDGFSGELKLYAEHEYGSMQVPINGKLTLTIYDRDLKKIIGTKTIRIGAMDTLDWTYYLQKIPFSEFTTETDNIDCKVIATLDYHPYWTCSAKEWNQTSKQSGVSYVISYW